ncbi:uncharacterized protein LOC131689610 [Topomyia yanbarensis]|uniref:uncharacterized protein LOC131689610 n=1 Tax=Topomyia yanbarensis TaxID=2498891 RepID=UPI00273B99A8|nr:uncharacterized protein LOC131689610 [Topomyia yanbarensis]
MAKIRDLPEEILILIFSFLKLRDRKVASRVSRLWNRLAFTDRPMKNISLHVSDYLDPKQRRVLLKSKRCYRNLTLEWTESSKVQYFVDVLEKFGTDLNSLKLSTYVVTPLILIRFLLKAPNLNELIIEGCFCSEGCDMLFPTFKNIRVLELTQRGFENEVCELIPRLFPSLTSLDLVAAEDAAFELIVFYGKQLKCLHVLLECSHFQKFCSLDCLENLRRIHVFWPQPSDYRHLVGCFQQMNLLQSASLTGTLNEGTFELICTRWKQLEHLCVNVQTMKAATFRNVTKLDKLTTLKLQGSIRECNFLKDIQLPKIRHFVLDGVSTSYNFYAHLAHFVPNVQTLKIYDHTFENAHLRLLTKTVPNLRALSLDYCYQVKDDGFQFLNCLTNLVELRCWSVPISENAFLRFPRCPNVRTLSIGGSGWITNKAVLDIPNPFPNLSELHIVDCLKVDEDTIWTLQKQMKRCAIIKLEKPEPDREREAAWQKCW